MIFSNPLSHFKKVDPVLYNIALKVSPLAELPKIPPDQYFSALCETIVSQQLSTKVADTIWERVVNLFPDSQVTRSQLQKIPLEKLRECGCSLAKSQYLKNVAEADIDYENLDNLPDKEITNLLLAIKGVGPWTAEMFLMFVMGRPDIFSYGDLGLRKAITSLPGLKNPETWSPYRSYASRVLWKSLEL